MTPIQKAQTGLQQIEEALSDLLAKHPEGLTNAEVTVALGLESDQDGKQRDYLAWSVLGRMMKAGTVVRLPATGKPPRTAYKLSQ